MRSPRGQFVRPSPCAVSGEHVPCQPPPTGATKLGCGEAAEVVVGLPELEAVEVDDPDSPSGSHDLIG